MINELFDPTNSSGFVQIGHFSNDRFHCFGVNANSTGIYFWIRRSADSVHVLRIGRSLTGFRSRHDLHNRWLLGLFKLHDPVEQARRRFTAEGLDDGIEIWAWVLSSVEVTKAAERMFKKFLGPTLELDCEVQGSVVNLKMKAWQNSRPV